MKYDNTVWIPEPKAQHTFCQLWRTQNEDYFQHIYSVEHRNAWNLMQNAPYYIKLDKLIKNISEEHFLELDRKETAQIESKENIPFNNQVSSIDQKDLFQQHLKFKNIEESSPQQKTSFSSFAARRQTLSSFINKTTDNSSNQIPFGRIFNSSRSSRKRKNYENSPVIEKSKLNIWKIKWFLFIYKLERLKSKYWSKDYCFLFIVKLPLIWVNSN